MRVLIIELTEATQVIQLAFQRLKSKRLAVPP